MRKTPDTWEEWNKTAIVITGSFALLLLIVVVLVGWMLMQGK